jgi:hemolysin activation/secretion protein
MPPPPRSHFQVCLWTAFLAAGALAQTPQTPNQQSMPLRDTLRPDAAAIAPPLPQAAEPSPAIPGILPEELLLVPPALPIPPDASQQPSRQPHAPFNLQLEPPNIEPILPAIPPGMNAAVDALGSTLKVRVNRFRFTGNKVFGTRELQKIVAPYAGREVTSMELEEARQAITRKYVDAGYINSGAILPDQDLKGGVILFQIVEGRLTQIQLKGNWWFRPWWLRHALRQSAGRPLNFEQLKTGLQLLRQDPNIRQINAELEPGGKPGESILKADVKENQPIRFGFQLSNQRPPSVGAEILDVEAADLNLTGHGDPFSIRWGVLHTTSDTLDHWQGSADENLSGSYEFPITPWRTTLEVHGSKSDAGIVEEPFNELGIKSRTVQYGAILRQPFYESLNNVFDLSVTAEVRESDTSLLGQAFDLSPGSIDGETRIFVMRFSMEYVNRSQQHVLALRSTVNWGIDAFDATVNSRSPQSVSNIAAAQIPDTRFVSWLGQAQYVRRLFNTDYLAVLRLNAQFSTDPLVSLEQFSLGGAQSVRGYRENQLLRDNGIFASAEIRIPLLRNKEKNPVLTLAPFFDYASGWNTVSYNGPNPKGGVQYESDSLYSVGLGLLFAPTRWLSGQIYWGYALNRDNIVRSGDNLQDYGFHFSLTVTAL